MRLRITAGVALATLLLPLGAGAQLRTASWQRIPMTYRPGDAFDVLGWAAGRVWLETGGNGFTIVSAKVSAGHLSSFVTTTEHGPAHDPWLTGGAVVWGIANGGTSMTAPLLANGHLGAATELSGDPEGVVAQAIGPTAGAVAVAGAAVGSRTVWLVEGGVTRSVNGGAASLMVCCSAAGAPTDLTPLLASRQQGIFASTAALGRDAQGRVWAAWGDSKKNTSIDPRLTGHLVQLDPTSLQIIRSTTYASILAPTYLVCADACRIAYAGTAISLWTAGKAPARIADSTSLRAAAGGSRLTLVTLGSKVKGDPQQGNRLTVSRGSATGAGERTITSVDVPRSYPGGPADLFYASGEPAAGVTPAGVVSFDPYVDHLNRTRVYSIVVR